MPLASSMQRARRPGAHCNGCTHLSWRINGAIDDVPARHGPCRSKAPWHISQGPSCVHKGVDGWRGPAPAGMVGSEVSGSPLFRVFGDAGGFSVVAQGGGPARGSVVCSRVDESSAHFYRIGQDRLVEDMSVGPQAHTADQLIAICRPASPLNFPVS
jgi:hypothetical protein